MINFQFQNDSISLCERKGFSGTEQEPGVNRAGGPDSVEAKTKFIESQIKTRIVEPAEKEKKQTAHKTIDTTIGSIVIPEQTGEFKFRDIINKNEHKGPQAVYRYTTRPLLKQFFTEHNLPRTHFTEISLNRENQAWVFIVLLILVFSFAWIRVFFNRTVRQLFAALVSLNTSIQMIRDENLLLQRASVMLTVLFNMVGALFLYQVSVKYNWSSDYIGTGFGRFLLLAFIISAVYSGKFIILRATGFIFLSEKPMAAYTFNIFLINNILGILFIPLVVAISFLPGMLPGYVIQLSFAIAGLAFIYRIFRGLAIGISASEFSKFHLLLYLCALELTPLLIIIKAALLIRGG